jgi:hypothetical protein
MAYKVLAGAPFDAGNLFIVPAVDAGLIINPYPDAELSVVDGGSLSAVSTYTIDGGTIPLEGTASYDPTKIYGPDDVVILPGINDGPEPA